MEVVQESTCKGPRRALCGVPSRPKTSTASRSPSPKRQSSPKIRFRVLFSKYSQNTLRIAKCKRFTTTIQRVSMKF